VPRHHAAVHLPLPPVHAAAGQLVAGLKRPEVFLPIAGGLGVQGLDDLGAVPPVAGPMGDTGFRPTEATGRPLRIMAFIPGIADQDELAADVAGRKLGGAAAAIVESLSCCRGKTAAGVGNVEGQISTLRAILQLLLEIVRDVIRKTMNEVCFLGLRVRAGFRFHKKLHYLCFCQQLGRGDRPLFSARSSEFF
jgi:hypothetical protein